MTKMIELSCSNCNCVLQRPISQVNASIKRGDKNTFCSQKCTGEFLHKTRTEALVCEYCSKQFTRNIGTKRCKHIFCSQSCAAKFNNKHHPRRQLQGSCSICNKPINKKKRYCSKECRSSKSRWDLSKTLQFYWDKSTTNNLASTYSTIREHARSITKSLPQTCVHCEYSKHVETCHLTAISDFELTATLGEINHISNLTLLCRNCHWEYDHNLLTIEQVRFSPSW